MAAASGYYEADAGPSPSYAPLAGRRDAAVCIVGTLYFHSRSVDLENERNLASWQQIAMAAYHNDPRL